MPRVLHINDYPAEDGGGTEVILRRTMQLVRSAGWRAESFTCADLSDPRRTPWRYLDNRLARRTLLHRLEAFRPDVVHVHNYYHVLSPGILDELAKHKERLGYRVLMTAHDYHLVCPNSGGNCVVAGAFQPMDDDRLRSWGYLLGQRWDHRGLGFSLLKLGQHLWNYRCKDVTRVLDMVICPSRYLQQLVERRGLATTLVPHPMPTLPPRKLAKPSEFRMVFAGRIEPEKGLYEFLAALPSDWHGTFTIVGSGGDEKRCRALAKNRFGERVAFVGRQTHADTIEEIARSHLLVLPSRCLESYGLTLLEALAVGTNIMTMNHGAMREIVEASGVGYLIDAADAGSVARQWKRVETDFAVGTLNRFDASKLLNDRSERAYIEQILRLYEGRIEETHRRVAA